MGMKAPAHSDARGALCSINCQSSAAESYSPTPTTSRRSVRCARVVCRLSSHTQSHKSTAPTHNLTRAQLSECCPTSPASVRAGVVVSHALPRPVPRPDSRAHSARESPCAPDVRRVCVIALLWPPPRAVRDGANRAAPPCLPGVDVVPSCPRAFLTRPSPRRSPWADTAGRRAATAPRARQRTSALARTWPRQWAARTAPGRSIRRPRSTA